MRAWHFTSGDPRERADRCTVCTQENTQKTNKSLSDVVIMRANGVQDGDDEHRNCRQGETAHKESASSKSPCKRESKPGSDEIDTLKDDVVRKRLSSTGDLEEESTIYE